MADGAELLLIGSASWAEHSGVLFSTNGCLNRSTSSVGFYRQKSVICLFGPGFGVSWCRKIHVFVFGALGRGWLCAGKSSERPQASQVVGQNSGTLRWIPEHQWIPLRFDEAEPVWWSC